eukprot:CAMPEP_0177760370 /NCGR_PEP_ID=MMETSP0491_2-20121128/5232_1 /TAXON_ID=63592 /ORGANISM="Tetraselmis chuii, Strain PLY429" /LENGTH=202 /DNA_ID=CAMNT_0019276267 /DNA_START=332 /DNA_END=940 /DNA_ORIENTATION=+
MDPREVEKLKAFMRYYYDSTMDMSPTADEVADLDSDEGTRGGKSSPDAPAVRSPGKETANGEFGSDHFSPIEVYMPYKISCGDNNDNENESDGYEDMDSEDEAALARGNVASTAQIDASTDDVVEVIMKRLRKKDEETRLSLDISRNEELLSEIVERALSVPVPVEEDMKSTYQTYYAHGLWRAVQAANWTEMKEKVAVKTP